MVEEESISETSATMPPPPPPLPCPQASNATIESITLGGTDSTCNNNLNATSSTLTTNNAETSALSSHGDRDKSLQLADEFMAKGSQALKENDFSEATDCFSRALEISVEQHGELAIECVKAYYKYGCALLYKAQEEADPLGAVPKKEGGSEQGSDKDASAKNAVNGESSTSSASNNAELDASAYQKEGVADEDSSGKDQEDGDSDDEDLPDADEDESDLDLAWKMLDVARAIVEKNAADTMEKVDILSALAEVALEREDIETSLSDYQKALSILERLVEPDNRQIAELNFRICLCLELGSRPEEAIPYCQKAISVCKSRVQQLVNQVNSLSGPASSSTAPELDQGTELSSNVCQSDISVSDKEAEIETLNGLSGELEKKLEGEREFQNELFFAARLESPFVVSVLGFSSDRKRRRMLLVYDLMSNGNLQDALLHRKCPELMQWKQRFSVALDIARGIEYLHAQDPPVIHGDIKPSNILLDENFSAKLGDFGLARLKSENLCEITVIETDGSRANGGSEAKKVDLESNGGVGLEDCGSIVETESVMTGFEDVTAGADLSPESFARVPYPLTSPETIDAATASPEIVPGMAAAPLELEKGSVSEGNFDRASIESGKEVANGAKRSLKGLTNVSGRDWWWKQDNGAAETGVVKDYVMEWIGTEIKKERPKSDWIGASSSNGAVGKSEKKKNRRRLDWWVSLDEDRNVKNGKKEKRRPAREWWKEEYCEELAKKKKRKKKKKAMGMHSDDNGGEDWWPRDEELYAERKKKSRSRSRSSRGSMDRWLDGFSGELWRARRNSHDSVSGDIPKSGGISSTPSMRGTVCYIAPEYGGGGDLSEKCDVYSFGVLLLVLVAGRRPLQVTSSPMSEFQRANLLSWARHLARAGKLIDLVDQSVQSLDRDQALLCITVALLCLQKSPSRRPSMKEVVALFTGESDPPPLPFEFSPSPPSRFPFKSQKKAR